MAAAGPFDVIVDTSDADTSVQLDAFERTFGHLREGGTYLVRRMLVDTESGVPDDLWSRCAAAQAARNRGFAGDIDPDLRWLTRRMRSFEVRGESLILTARMPGRAKIREEEVSTLLADRPDLGRVISVRPAADLVSSATYTDNADTSDPARVPVFRAPELQLRRYDDVICSRGQIVATDHHLLPDSYRHPQLRRLVNIYIDDLAPLFGEIRHRQDRRRSLQGAYYYLDSEAPGHFGHLLTEQVSRLWGWQQAKKSEPALKLLLSLHQTRPSQRLEAHELSILEAVGITEDDVVVFDDPVRVERLYAGTPMFACPDRGSAEGGEPYVHPDIGALWRRIGDHVAERAPSAVRPRRLFVSRRPSLKRACHNLLEVENLFREHDFTVLYPEEHSMAEQVALFRAAEVVAGFAGSALFTLAFCADPTDVIALAPSSYTGRNEYPISSVIGHRLTVVWSSSDIDHPPGGWTREAFMSGFTFDMDREGRYLRAVLDAV